MFNLGIAVTLAEDAIADVPVVEADVLVFDAAINKFEAIKDKKPSDYVNLIVEAGPTAGPLLDTLFSQIKDIVAKIKAANPPAPAAPAAPGS